MGRQHKDDKKEVAKASRSSGKSEKVAKKPKKEKKKKLDKLLILDLNHVLICRQRMSTKFRVRPYATQFVVCMAKHFKLALWSSARKDTVKRLLRGLFQDPGEFNPSAFLFIWNQSMCTRDTESEDVQSDSNDDEAAREKYYGLGRKPLFRKDLSRVYERFPEYAGKTLLLDDSPKKGLFNNPAAMATIKKYTKALDDDDDSDTELCEGSELCQRLEALAKTEGALY